MSQTAHLIETLTHQGIDLWVDGGQLRYRGPKALLTPERLAQLKVHKGELLHTLTTTTYAATWEQQQLWAAYHATPEKRMAHVAFAAQLQGVLALDTFQRTWQTLVQRHATLRTIYHAAHASNGHDHAPPLVATVLGTQAVTITQLEAQHWHAAALQAQLDAQAALPFDLAQGGLLRITLFARAATEHTLLVTVPRIALDEPSLAQLLAEFGQLYATAHEAAWTPLPPLSATPAAYAAWQRAQPILSAPADLPGAVGLTLPLDYARPAQPSQACAQAAFALDADLTAQLQTLAGPTNRALEIILLTAFHLLLQRYTGQEQLLVNLALSPRRLPAFRDLVGGFTTLIPFATTWETSVGLAHSAPTLLAAMQQQVETVAAQLAALPAPAPIIQAQVAFAFHHFAAALSVGETAHWGELTVTPLPLEVAANPFELKLDVAEVAGTIRYVITYRPDLFAPTTITRMGGHLHTLLAGIVAEPTQPVMQLPMVTAAERHQLLVAWNHTGVDYPQATSIVQLFEAQVLQRPDAVALVFRGAKPPVDQLRPVETSAGQTATAPTQLTYAELNARANQLAHQLQALGGGPETLVGICVDRSLEMVVGLLGVLKAGYAYVPLDPAYPQERIAFMVADSAVAILLTQAALVAQLPPTTAQILCLDEAWPQIAQLPSDNLPSPLEPEQLAYVIYTSGSTGRPKGVQIVQRALTNFLCSMQQQPGFTADDTLLSVTTLSFDIAGLELYLPLISGGTVLLVDQATTRNGVELAAAIADSGATVMQATPATWQLLLTAGWQGAPTLKLLCGGEALPRSLADQLLRCGKELWNLYGPTETTIWSTLSPVVRDHAITIGGGPQGTVANTQLYVLDAALQPVPIGVSGELHIGGDGVARGYLNRPDLTAEKFIDNPFAAPATGARLYKTGDLVRWRLDAAGLPQLEYLGRIDQQVKIRGFRIEQGEIEALLRQHPAVQEAVVAVHEQQGDKQLVAYLTPAVATAYPVRQLLRWEREGRLAARTYTALPNQMSVFYHNRSELAFLYREILAEAAYLHHGITLPPGSCVFDVGANIGMFSLFVHQQCADATLYSFEPIPPIYELLCLNTELYGVNAKTFNYGLASTSGTGNFTYYPQVSVASTRFGDAAEEQAMIKSYLQNQSDAELSPTALDDLLAMRLQGEQITCQFKTLSEVIAEQGITQIDLLKVDVEKSELDVLRGIAEADWPKIKQVVLEVHDVQLRAIHELLEAHGFRCIIEEETMLKKTGLHNLYAIHSSYQGRGGDLATSPQAAPRFNSPAHLIQAVQHYLRQMLPDYMVPAAFVLLDALPLTPNGKVDKKALPAPQAAAELHRAAPVEPSNPIEMVIAQIWAEALNRPAISIHDKFMELGGHSLQAMQVVAKIGSTFQIQFPLSLLFASSTVAELAQQLVKHERKPGQMLKLARLQQRLNQLA